MKVLVTGSSGYIGSKLVPILKIYGHDVSEFDLVTGQKLIETHKLITSLAGVETVIHLAAYSNNDLYEKHRFWGDHVNKDSFKVFVELARNAGVKRFIYASSVAAYGSGWELFDETYELAPQTLYGKAKAYCEQILREVTDMTTCSVRSASVCGWSPRMRWDVTVNQMIYDGTKKGVITVNGGNQVRCHIHLDDLCDLYATLLNARASDIHHQAFNAVHINQPVRETAELVGSVMGVPVMYGPKTDDRSYQVSGEKARIMLGFTPLRTIEQAVRDTVASISERGGI